MGMYSRALSVTKLSLYACIGIFEALWGEMWGREGDSDGGSDGGFIL
jgi:hypothetical protein